MFEKYGTQISVSVLALAYLFFGLEFFEIAKENMWSINSIYASVFDMSSIVCAFLFSFFVFVKTTTNRYLDAARGSNTYNKLLKYFVSSIVSSFALSVVTIPFLVVNPAPTQISQISYLTVFPWVLLSGYVFAAVIRSAYHFVVVIDWAYGEKSSA